MFKSIIDKNIIKINSKEINNRNFYFHYIKTYHCENDVERAMIDKIFRNAPCENSITRIRNMLAKEGIIEKDKNYAEQIRVAEEYSPLIKVIEGFRRYFNI